MKAENTQEKRKRPGVLTMIISAVLVFLAIKFFIFDVKIIRGYSMAPRYEPGDVAVVNRLAYGVYVPFAKRYLYRWSVPKPSDVVLFYEPGSNREVIKRCAGIPGDTLYITSQTLIIRNRSMAITEDQFEKLEGWNSVPDNSVFLVGDNTWRSKDSRNFGFVPYNRVQGKLVTRR